MSDFMHQKSNDHFSRQRVHAGFLRLFSFLTRKDTQLLSLEEVRSMVKIEGESYRGIKAVPINKVVGSEGRYLDFTRHFLPNREHLRYRWMSIDQAHQRDVNLPAVKLYKLSDCYFVRDGNHRISVARSINMLEIDAEVIELDTKVEIPPDITRNKLKPYIINYEKKIFFEQTKFDVLLPHVRLEVTEVGRYAQLVQHIEGHKYFVNQGHEKEIPFDEAMLSWYFNVYKPIVEQARKANILSYFPHRSEVDLYLWIVHHWHRIKMECGEHFSMSDAIGDIIHRHEEAKKSEKISKKRGGLIGWFKKRKKKKE